jgi:hypothetical protein
MKLGICLPTNNPTLFIRDFLPSIINISELKNYSEFLIHFQDPWTTEQIEHVIEFLTSNNWIVKWCKTGVWDKPIKFVKMRDICAKLDTSCKYYMLCDDDMKFSSGTPVYQRPSGARYTEVIDYLDNYPTCGFVQCKPYLGGYHQQYKIVPRCHTMIATDRGLVFRNMFDIEGWLIVPDEILELRGALEETALGYSRIELGYYGATQMNNPTHHNATKISKLDLPVDDMHHQLVIYSNIGGWVRNRYDDFEWDYERKYYPSKLLSLYKDKSGIDYPISDDFIKDFS